jgi:hypothetical protein
MKLRAPDRLNIFQRCDRHKARSIGITWLHLIEEREMKKKTDKKLENVERVATPTSRRAEKINFRAAKVKLLSIKSLMIYALASNSKALRPL